ncbi:ubiquitin carboxyl-terminal hydrolase 46-like [Styela clava]
MKGCLPSIMGANASALVKDIGPEQFPPNEHYFGFINFGNTCYCNSVLQALFFCPPFREKVLQYRQQLNGKHGGNKKETLLSCLCDLFHSITTQKKKVGVIQPKKFVAKLRKENEQFDNYLQHDAHEFINYLLNYIADVLKAEKKAQLEKQRLHQSKLDDKHSIGEVRKDRKSMFSRGRKDKIKPEKQDSSNDGNGVPLTNRIGASSFLTSLKLKAHSENPNLDGGNASTVSSSSGTGSSINQEETNSTKILANGTPDSIPNSELCIVNENSEYSSSSSAKSSLTSSLQRPTRNTESSSSSSPLIKWGRKKNQNGDCASLETDENSHASYPYDRMRSMGDNDSTSTWVHEIFQGTLTNETRCLTCETVSSKDEDFLDLSVDVEQNTSISHCLRGFSNTETLSGEHKYDCEVCCSKQEAEKRMRVKKLPVILALHLKRFKMDSLQRYTKLSYRVVFPFELRLFNTSDDATNAERLYDLIAVVVHCGSGPSRGHYITIVKSHGLWLLFDDDIVEKIEPNTIEDFYGLSADIQKNSESGYILFYQCKE